MAKKKINPEDLQLNEELVNRSVTPQDDSTITCLSEDTCNSAKDAKCNQTELVCMSNKCASDACPNSRSLDVLCCDDTYNCLPTNFICQERPSIDVCLVTEINCVEMTKYCNAETENGCVLISDDCTPSINVCIMTKDDTCDMASNNCVAP